MKLMVVMIASLCLIATSWAQGKDTENGRKSKSMQTVKDITMVAPARSMRKALLPNYGNARASRRGTAASLPSPP